MKRVKGYVGWILFTGFVVGLFGAWHEETAHGDTAVIRGTVGIVRPDVIYLTEAREGGEEGAGRDVMVTVGGDTEYYSGSRLATADAVVPGLRVVVRCEREGKTLRATMVRIVGGSPR